MPNCQGRLKRNECHVQGVRLQKKTMEIFSFFPSSLCLLVRRSGPHWVTQAKLERRLPTRGKTVVAVGREEENKSEGQRERERERERERFRLK